MKKILFAILVVVCACFISSTKVAYATEYEEYEVRYEPIEKGDYSDVKQVIETEMLYDIPGNGIMPLSNYEEIDFSKKMSYIGILADGTERPLFSVTLSGVFYYYDDGSVHLYSLRATTYVYEENSYIDGVTPQINNTDGSSSEGVYVFNFVHNNLGIYICRSAVGFTKNSTVVSSSLEIIDHLLP